MKIQDFIRDVQDFPKEGILFKDITPLLNNPDARQEVITILKSNLPDVKIDKVVGVESRGFFFGMLLAEALGVGFIPVRKKGKLPFETISASYDLEYGTDTLEIHKDAISEGENVIIHDDVLATGGTIKAVCELVQNLGGKISQVNFLMELEFLNGKEKLNGINHFSVIKY